MNSRIPSLDGLRALAVLIVFVGHGRTDQGFWPGHLGVTIFFFLSGYLITTLLRREIETTSSIRLGRFYLRRSFRILPAAYFTVFLAIALAGAGILPAQIDGWGVVAELLNVTNYYIIGVGDAGLPPETSQMWTLAVEEQYYLVVPVALLLAYKAGATRHLIGRICIVIALAVPVWRIVLGLNGAVFDRLYSATDTRIDSILWGAALALLLNPVTGDRLRRPNRITRWVAAHLPLVAGASAVVVATTSIVPSMAFELSIADTIQGISLIAIFWFLITRPESAVGRLFNSRVAVHLGVLSFSIYLLHKIVLALVGPTIDFPLLTDGVSLLLSIAAAQLVYWIVERPAVRLRGRIEMALDKRNRATAHRPHIRG